MTPAQKVRKYVVEFPEPSRKAIVGWMLGCFCAILTLITTFHCNNTQVQHDVAAKLDSTAKPQMIRSAKIDTILNIVKSDHETTNEIYRAFNEHIAMANLLIPQVKQGLYQDSLDIHTLFTILGARYHKSN